MITSRPSRASVASWRDHSPIAHSSRPRPSLVTRLEPTLTTMRRASRSTPDFACSGILETRSDVDRGLLRDLRLAHMLVHRLHERFGAFAREGRDLEHRSLVLETLDEVLHARLAFVGRHHVDLVQHEPARLRMQCGVVLLQLPDDRLRLHDRIDAFIERRDVDKVQKDSRALQVAQELVAEARAFGGALDEARHIGDDETLYWDD